VRDVTFNKDKFYNGNFNSFKDNVEMQKGSRHWKAVCVEGDSLFLSSRVEAVLL